MKNTRFIIHAILLSVITLALTAAGVFAQNNGGEILVDGNPPFTQSDFESVVKYYERGLDIKFSDEEREEFQAKITAAWRKHQKSNGENLADFLQSVRKLNTVSDEKVKAHRQEFTDALLADLKAMSRNGWSQFVIDVYEKTRGDSTEFEKSVGETSSQTQTSSQTKPNADQTGGETDFKLVSGAIGIADLIGKWNKGSVASYGYRDSVANDYKSGYGAANQHEIYANGSFDYTNYAQVSLYNCTIELFTAMKGRVRISGSQVTFTYVSGTVKGKDSCKAAGFTKPAQIRTTVYRVERGRDQIRLCEVGSEQSYCLYKVKE